MKTKYIILTSIFVLFIKLHETGPLAVGDCPSISGVGNPVLMISHAHKHLVDSLNKENPHTHVSFVYRESFPSTEDEGHTVYKLLFKITDHNGISFYGLTFDMPPTERMVLKQIVRTEDIDTVALFIGTSNLQSKLTDYECGDLKFLFSSYGQKPTSDLPYVFVGRNNNSVGANLLSRLSDLNKEVAEESQVPKVCNKTNYLFSFEFIDINTTTSGTFNDYINCIETGPPIKAIRINCRPNDNTAAFVTETGPVSFIRYLELVYNNADGTTTDTPIFEHSTLSEDSEIVEINIDQADTITFLGGEPTVARGNTGLEIITKDKNGNEIASFGCGETLSGTRLTEAKSTADPVTNYKQVIPAIDFLGFKDLELNSANSTVRELRLARYVAS